MIVNHNRNHPQKMIENHNHNHNSKFDCQSQSQSILQSSFKCFLYVTVLYIPYISYILYHLLISVGMVYLQQQLTQRTVDTHITLYTKVSQMAHQQKVGLFYHPMTIRIGDGECQYSLLGNIRRG